MRAGERFVLAGRSYKVLYVNASRAHCVCTDTQEVTIGGRSFTAHSTKTIDLSPNSALDILADLQPSKRREKEARR